MSGNVPVSKDEFNQSLIPTAWRPTIIEVVEGLKNEDFDYVRRVPGVRAISADDETRIAANINRYGDKLTSLPVETWQTSVCQWMDGYWDALVDLYTQGEGASDLVLELRIHEEGAGYLFEIVSVHIP